MPRRKANPQKRGAKGYFTSSRLEFLNSYTGEYISLRGKNRAKFWHKFFEAWWNTYPWRLGDDEEPPVDDAEKMQVLSKVGFDKDLKKEVETKLKGKITTWFSYRSTIHNSLHEGGAWFKVLKHFHERIESKPRRRSVPRQFTLEYPAKVKAAFEETFKGRELTPDQRMNGQYDVAKSLVETTQSHLVDDLARHAKETHERELREWSLGLDEIGEAEDIQSARDSLFSAVHPLLKFIGRYSGCYVTLLASSVSSREDGKAYFSAVHHFPEDRPVEKNWTEYDEEAFKDGVARPFVRYIHWMEGSEGEAPKIEQASATDTPVPSPRPPSTVHPRLSAGTSRQPAHVDDQSKNSNKRRITAIESSSDEEDVDMTMEGNSSSGSSLGDPDEFTAKRLRTSVIVTRGSGLAANLQSTAVAAGRNGCVSSNAAEDGVAIKSVNTSDVGETAAGPTPNTPTPSILSLPQTDIDPIGRLSPDISVSALPLHIELANDVLSDMETKPSKPVGPRVYAKVPDFLKTGKHKIYNYLIDMDEPGFKKLLDEYVAFELADRSGIRGALPTDGRPKPIAWWTSRSRPNKIPPYDRFCSFTSGITGWWISIQPDWRRLKCGKTSRHEGDLKSLYQPGVNGLLNVVILVYWWARVMEERREPAGVEYRWLVSDVTWVLSQLTGVARGGFGA